jgi:hypothetical protein
MTAPPRLVILESPYAGATPEETERNVAYARACLRDSLLRGEAPMVSHLLYTQPGVFDDQSPTERVIEIVAGLAWLKAAEASVVYTDLGISKGMNEGIEAAKAINVPIEFRSLSQNLTDKAKELEALIDVCCSDDDERRKAHQHLDSAVKCANRSMASHTSWALINSNFTAPPARSSN